jgi:hypothetical protein
MLSSIQAWLNGTREYFMGLELFAVMSDDTRLIEILRTDKNQYNHKRLQEEMTKICAHLKNKVNPQPNQIPQNSKLVDVPIPIIENTELHEAALNEANKSYKATMNARAVLFAMARDQHQIDFNTPEKVKQRGKLALQVLILNRQTSQLYDNADFVKVKGRVPATDQDEEEENDYSLVPDDMVKQKLDNMRKNYNKMKDREKTVTRVALLQKHKKAIEILEARWLSLKQKN